MFKTKCAWLPIAIVFSGLVARGDDSSDNDKRNFWLWKPTPASAMRPWVTDIGGVSPYTIDAGHFEFRVNAVAYDYAHQDQRVASITTSAWSFGDVLLKAGIADRLDAEVSIVPYEQVTTRARFGYFGRVSDTRSGFGDVTARLKMNIWGDDGGTTALSLSGIINFPTAQDHLGDVHYSGGPALEFAAQLPMAFELRIDCASIFFNDGHASIENLLSLDHAIIGDFSGYVLFNTVVATVDQDWVGAIETGFKYRLRPNIELYAGASFGVHQGSDYSPFVGVAARF